MADREWDSSSEDVEVTDPNEELGVYAIHEFIGVITLDLEYRMKHIARRIFNAESFSNVAQVIEQIIAVDPIVPDPLPHDADLVHMRQHLE